MTIAGSLEIHRGHEVRRYTLTQPTTTIGRATDNQVVLSDSLVSRHHARLTWAEGVYYITDLGSTNGTWLNGVELEAKMPRALKEGDTIRIGEFTLVLRLRPSAQEARPAPRKAERLVPEFLETTRVLDIESQVLVSPTTPLLIITTPRGTKEFHLDRDVLSIGRSPENDLVIDEPIVSRRHAQLKRVAGGYEIVDMGSKHGLVVGGTRVPKKRLVDGDVLWIAQSVSLTYKAAAEAITAPAPQKLDLRGRTKLTIGRHPHNDIILDHPAISRTHAYLARRDGGYVIEDVGSTNGTFVNGKRIAPGQAHTLRPGDTIRIGPIKFIFEPDTLNQVDESRDLQLDALHLNHFIGKKLNLLQDISLSVSPAEFVAIVGVSGAGKSTLLNALSGFRPANRGAVLVNGTDLYRNFDAYRTQLGYVPQEDIIHKELTVYEALDYAGQLRLPADTTPTERQQRVMEVLQTLDITERKDVPVHRLSGGQRKRVSIGVELLTQPGLFFLDEATSGLDPGTESQMMKLLRKLADQGHTILLVTHATKNVMQCDLVAFLAKGGHLAYYGPPEEALAYFEVQDFDAIYEKLESGLTPAAWANRYRQSTQYQKFVAARLKGKDSAAARMPRPQAMARQLPGAAIKQVSALRQLAILSRRNLNILFRDKASLVLMLLLAPLIGTMDFVIWKKGVFATQGGSATQGLTGLFFMALICILVGAIASMREIVKETDIYRRERMVTLKIGPYILSKVWMGVLLALYQSAVFILTKRLAASWPTTSQVVLQMYVTLVLATLSGMLIGLLISAVSPNQNAAPLVLLLILVPQFVFAGGMMPLNTFGKAGEVISQAITTRWAFESLVTISDLGRAVAEDYCWQLPEAERDALTEQDKDRQCTCMGPNMFRECNFPGVRDLYDPAVDEPEPAQPPKPRDPPPQPARPAKPAPDSSPEDQLRYQEAMQEYERVMEQYQEDIEAYQTAMKKYQNDMERWKVRYQEWKEKHDKAIGEGEGLIEKIYEDYGWMFKVNLARHWGRLALIIAVLFGLIFVVQWRKDVI